MLNYYNHVDMLKSKANSNQINDLNINTVQGFNFTLVMPQMSCNRYNYNFTCNLPNRDIQCSNSGSLLNDLEIINVLRTYTQSNILHNTNQWHINKTKILPIKNNNSSFTTTLNRCIPAQLYQAITYTCFNMIATFNIQNALTNKIIQNSNYINNCISYTNDNTDTSNIADVEQKSKLKTVNTNDINQNNNTEDSNDKNKSFCFKEKGLHISSLNIQHILPKLDEIKLHLRSKNSSNIFGLCETFLTSNVHDSCLHINSFSFERKDRNLKKGGGILVYISDAVPYIRRLDLENDSVECIWIQICFPNCKPFLIGFIYRPPNALQSWIDLFQSLCDTVDDLKLETYLLGDINIKYIKTNNNFTFENTKWETIMLKYGYKQLIESATRVTKTSTSIIDHIYTNRPEV